MKKFSKRLFVTILCCLCLMLGMTETVYGYTLNYTLLSWDLVDSGRHLDWDGSTKYMAEWKRSVRTWNSYKKGVIRADRWNIIEDVRIRDKSKKDGCTFASTFSSGSIIFYKDTMDRMTSKQRQATITHEIGHALGLGHNNKNTSVMRQGYKNFTALDDIDKKGYDAAYKKY